MTQMLPFGIFMVLFSVKLNFTQGESLFQAFNYNVPKL